MSSEIEEIEERFKALVVATIMEPRTGTALSMLCERYGVDKTKLMVGRTGDKAGRRRTAYLPRSREIVVRSKGEASNPTVILSAFYSHLRNSRGRNAKYGSAREFVRDYLAAYRNILTKLAKSSLHGAASH